MSDSTPATAASEPFFSPYCDHPECHSAYVSDYSEYGTGCTWPVKMTSIAYLGGGGIRRRLGRRWCRSHAQLNEGWSFG